MRTDRPFSVWCPYTHSHQKSQWQCQQIAANIYLFCLYVSKSNLQHQVLLSHLFIKIQWQKIPLLPIHSRKWCYQCVLHQKWYKIVFWVFKTHNARFFYVNLFSTTRLNAQFSIGNVTCYYRTDEATGRAPWTNKQVLRGWVTWLLLWEHNSTWSSQSPCEILCTFVKNITSSVDNLTVYIVICYQRLLIMAVYFASIRITLNPCKFKTNP